EGKKSELQQWKDFIENARLIARQERHLMDSIVHIKAENALQRKEFVLESDELTLKHGEHGYVNSTTNFIALHDGRAHCVNTPPFQSGGGPNGVGGITVEVNPTGLKMETDKKGITRLSTNVTGNGISAQVTVTLNPSDNRATATIIPNFNSLNVTLDGQLVPFEGNSVFKGTTF
ncbi:MAG: DUF4251 domain-containing protein, partial [Parabacteroides johnsonii]